jgi:dephospho-CoA kinase
MQKIGLTGGIGSGKTTVAKLFEMLGVPVFYADLEAHYIRNRPEISEQIVRKFGEGILANSVVSRTSTTEFKTDSSVAEALKATENQIDTRKLANVIFNNDEALQWINHLLHPLVEQEFETWCKLVVETQCIASLRNIVIMESALIFEAKFERLFDKIIVVDAPEDLRISRVMNRENISKNEVLQRMSKQISADEKRQKADFIIQNDEKHSLIEQVVAIAEGKVLELSALRDPQDSE